MKQQHCLYVVKRKTATSNTKRLLAIIAMVSLGAAATLANAQIQLVSVSIDGTNGGNGGSFGQVISADGRFVAFVSTASDLVSNDTNGLPDIFVRDLQNGTTALVSVNRDGTNGGNGNCRLPAISADGRFVAFLSLASDLVANDANGLEDVYVHDLQTGTTALVSINRNGTNGGNGPSDSFAYTPPGISADGRFVAFESSASDLVSNDTNGLKDIFVRDLQNGTTILVTINRTGSNAGNGNSFNAKLSADGRFVAFESLANDLVNGDTNFSRDIFVHDLQNGTTSLASIKSNGTNSGSSAFNPAISADGRFVAFVSFGAGLVTNDTNGTTDVYVRDLENGRTILASISHNGTNGGNNQSFDQAISADGRFVVFRGPASDLVSNDTNGQEDVFVRDLQSETTTLVSVNRDGIDSGNNYSIDPVISADGRFVAFQSMATDLVNNSTSAGVFLRDLQNGTTNLVSANSGDPVISADGRFVVFRNYLDIFVLGSNQPPTAGAGGPYDVNEGGSVTVTASGNDPEGGPLTYAWDFDNDGSFETPGQSVSFSAANLDGPSNHLIKVQVTDNGNLTATAQATVNVLNVAPTAIFTATPSTIIEGQSVTLFFSNQFDPSAADVTAGFTYSYDCTSDGTFEASDMTAPSYSCAFPASGTFTAHGRIKDKDSGFTDYTIEVTVLTSQQAAENLITQVQALDLPQGNGLVGKLNVVIDRLDHDRLDKAIEMLQQFIDQVNVFIGNSTLTTAEGQPLIDAANAIIAALSNPAPAAAAVLKQDASKHLAASELPTEFQLAQNYPNPFNPSTTISFALPQAVEVSLSIYDMSGQLVKQLIATEMTAGHHSVRWDATNDHGVRVASGMYLYLIKSGTFTAQRKLVLMK